MVLKEMKSTLPPGSYYFSGNEAAAEGAIAARCGYYGGYPITPSSELMHRIAFRFRETGGVFMQMEDELASICSVIGAVWAGARAMTATSGPGFSLMQEAIGYAVMTETPIVIVDVQRVGPATGQATRPGSGDMMQAKWGSHGDREVIAISPWSVQEMYDQTINAFNLAERYRVPVILLSDEAIAHLRERMEVRERITIFNRRKEKGAPPFGAGDDGVPPMPAFGEGERLLVTASTHTEYGIRKTDDPLVQAKLSARLHNKIVHKRDEIIEYENFYIEDAEVVVVAYGFTARSSLFAVEKLRQEGKKVGMIRLKTIWPFADRLLRRNLGAKVKKVFVPEMNIGQMAGEIMKYTPCDVISFSQTNGEVIYPYTIMEQLERLL